MEVYNSIVISLIYLIRIVWLLQGLGHPTVGYFEYHQLHVEKTEMSREPVNWLKKNSEETQERQNGAWMGRIGKDWNGETWNLAARLFQVLSICVMALFYHRSLNKRRRLSRFKFKD